MSMSQQLPRSYHDLKTVNTVFIKKLVEQIRREFYNFDWDVLEGDFIEGGIDKIKAYLRYDIEDFYVKHQGLFNHFLYRVDISNDQIQKYTTEHVFEDVYECIAELVIIRCAQKVFYKQKYS